MTSTPDPEQTADAPLTPEAALALAGRQQSRMDSIHLLPVTSILVAWGVAWGVGFLLIWLSRTPLGGEPAVAPAAAWITFAVLLAAAVVVSAVVGSRIGRGIKGGDGSFVGGIYGVSWSIAPIAITAMGIAFARAGADSTVLDLFYPSAYSLVVGMLYIVGAALFRAVPMIPLGGWILLVGTVAPFVGSPANYLVMSIGGGGGFLVGAAAILIVASLRLRTDPTRRALAGGGSRG